MQRVDKLIIVISEGSKGCSKNIKTQPEQMKANSNLY